MNVTVTTTVTLIIQQSPYEVLTVIAAFAAFVVSAFTLYFTSLKGPDIVLLEKPQFIQQTIQRDSFDRSIPDTFNFEANLVFLNNGTASGVLRVDASFEPTKELIPFFKKATFMFGTEPYHYTSGNSMPPVATKEKGSIVVYNKLTVELYDWKRHFTHESVPKEKICEVLCQADSENKKRFSDFCAVLKNGMHIGTVSIKSGQTVRKKTEERIHIGVLDDELIRNFGSWVEKWNIIDPDVILSELRQVHDHFNRYLCTPLEDNARKLRESSATPSLDPDLLQRARQGFHGSETGMTLADFILRSTQLDSSLEKYDVRTNEWNRKSQLYNEDPLNQRLRQALAAERPLLERESANLAGEMVALQKTLYECYTPSS